MRLFLACVILALSFSGSFAQIQCSNEVVNSCAASYTSCSQAASGQPASVICECFRAYGICLQQAGCTQSHQAFTTFQQQCQAATCGTDVCLATAVLPATVTETVIATSPATCSSQAALTCSQNYAVCVQGQTSQAEICNCFRTYGTCLQSSNCIPGSQYDIFQQQCSAANCGRDICGVGGVVDACAACATTRAQCITAVNPLVTEQVCSCYSTERDCLLQNHCNGTAVFQLFNQNCQIAGCAAGICLVGPATVSCAAAETASCSQAFSSCSARAQGNRQNICTCYATWGTCLSAVGCTSGSSFETFRQNCLVAGCGSICPGGVGAVSPASSVIPSFFFALCAFYLIYFF